MADLNVITIAGSLRKGSYNAALARMLPKLAPAGLALAAAPGFDQIPLYNFDVQEAGVPAAATAWADAVRAADAVIIVSPEYNFGIPGGLKNAIDWASRMKDQPFVGKPVAMQSCATGPLGGSRMQHQLRHVLTGIDAVVFGRPEIFVSFAAQKFDPATMEIKDQPTIDIIKQQLAAFAGFARKITGKS